MPGSADASYEVLRFEDCELSKAERLLIRSGRIVPLQARPFDLLAYLVDNRDRVIPREEILNKVWRGIRVNEEALRFSVHAIRRAIGDDGQSQKVIRTVRGNGLQFVARVSKFIRGPGHRASGNRDPLDPQFLGRESFLRSVERAMAEASCGSQSTILTTGEPGVGKTTALLQAATLACDTGFRVGSTRCVGTDEAPALWPWTQVLRRLVEEEAENWIKDTLQRGAEAVAWLLPELQELVPRSLRSPTSDSRVSRFRLLEGVQLLVESLASRVPLAIFVDDLHEADQASLRLFEHLAAQLDRSRVFLFGTYRAHGGAYQKCEALVSSVLRTRGSQLITLSGLSETEVAIVAASYLGDQPSTEAVKSIFAKTNGNPFFVIQIMKVLESEGRLGTLNHEQPLEYSIPRGVRDAIRRQTDLLPETVKKLLELAAVIEAEFSLDLLCRALGKSPPKVLEDITIALDSGILVEDERESAFRFAHALVRDSISESLSPAERAKSHQRVAVALEDVAEGVDGSVAADIAKHYAAAFPAELSDKAVRWLIRAARWDTGRAAFESAVAHLERAMGHLGGATQEDLPLRCELRLELGMAYGLAGRREDSRIALTDAYRLATACGSWNGAARAALLFAPDLLAIETGIYDSELVELLEGALRILPADSEDRPRILARLAVALHWSDEPRSKLQELVRAAMSESSRQSDAGAASFVKVAGTLALYSVESPHESIRLSQPDGAEDDSTALMRTILRITALWQVGRIRDVDIEIDGFSSLLHRAHRRSAAWYMSMLRSTMALMKGQYELAQELAEQFLREGLAVEDRNALHSFALQRALMAIDVGGLQELEPAVTGMATAFPRVEGWSAGLCYLYCELGKLDEARSTMESVIARGALGSFPRNSWFGTLASLALACRVLEAPALARDLSALWQRFSGQLAVVGFSSYCWGATDRFIGLLAGLRCDWEHSDQCFARAIAINQAAGALPALAHTFADRAAILDRRKAGSGRRYWDLALKQARLLGMSNLEKRIILQSC